jgi:hypothetical protein
MPTTVPSPPLCSLYDVCVGHKSLPAFQSAFPALQLTASLFRVNLYSSRGLLPYPHNRVLCSLGNTKFDDRLRWNLDLLLRLGIKARACFPLLLHQFAKTGQDKFASLFDLFVSERAKSIQKYSPRFFCRSGWLRRVRFGVRSWSSVAWLISQTLNPRHPSSFKPGESSRYAVLPLGRFDRRAIGTLPSSK